MSALQELEASVQAAWERTGPAVVGIGRGRGCVGVVGHGTHSSIYPGYAAAATAADKRSVSLVANMRA